MPEKQEKENEGDQETLDFNKPDYEFIPKGTHDWRQQGPYLVCKSCELQHAVWIGVKKRLVGINKEGNPMLEELEELEDLK